MSGTTAGRCWDLSITLRSPFLIRATRTDNIVVDAAVLRRSDSDRRIVLPGTLVKGLLRDAIWTLLAKKVDLGLDDQSPDDLATTIGRAFGVASGRRRSEVFETDETVNIRKTGGKSGADTHVADNDPMRGLLKIDDLVADQTEETDETDTAKKSDGHLTRIHVDEDLGSVREGHLQVVELPFPLGKEVTFRGRVTLFSGVDISADNTETLIKRALRLVRAIGGFKSAGFGEVVRSSLTRRDPSTGTESTAAKANAQLPADFTTERDTVLELVYRLDRPFVVNSNQRGGNAFEGDQTIPGAVFKGALANRLQDLGRYDEPISELLAVVTFGHAIPVLTENAVAGKPRPLVVPLSRVRVNDAPRDLLSDPDAGTDTKKVPKFQTDWKGSLTDTARKEFGWPDPGPKTEARTRTAIDYGQGAARWDDTTETGQLFTEIAVVPYHHRWIGRLAMPAGTDPAGITQLIACLAEGVPRVGKTEAIVNLDGPPRQLEDPALPTRPLADGRKGWIVVLQTDALINDLGALRASNGDIEADYQAYWSDRGFDLIDWYAAQRLYGGYLAKRYPQHPDRYDPYLLTKAGSAFLLAATAANADPEAELRTFLRFGLPLAKPYQGLNWQTCPFLRENGFGAITVGTDPKSTCQQA